MHSVSSRISKAFYSASLWKSHFENGAFSKRKVHIKYQISKFYTPHPLRLGTTLQANEGEKFMISIFSSARHSCLRFVKAFQKCINGAFTTVTYTKLDSKMLCQPFARRMLDIADGVSSMQL